MTGTGRRSSKGGGKKSTTPTSTLKKSGNSSTLTTKTKGIVPQRRRAIAMSRQQPANPVEGDNAQPPPQPAVDPLARRGAHVQLQPYIAGPADADAGLVPGANPVLTSDESVAVLQAFPQRPDLPRSPKTKASLDHMRAVIAAHAANSLDETDLRNAMATMDLILVARQGIVPVGDALRAQRGPSLTEDSYKVVVDGQEIMSFNAAQIRQLQMACFGNAYEKDTRALGLVMAGFEFEGTMKELVNLVCAVHRCLADPGPARLVQGQTAVDGNPGVAEHVRQLLQEEVAERSELAKVFRDAALNVSVDGITAPQCRALHAWLRLHPNYLMNLKGLGVKGFVFGSKDIFDVGEYLGGKRAEVHMSAQPDKPADAFVRLVLHESGHAGFQRA